VIQKKKERSGIEGTLSYQDWQQTTPENRWQVYPESEEAYRQELRREEEAQIERAREAGTTLLSASKNGEGTVRLEPVEAGGTVIQISYIPFTLGKHPDRPASGFQALSAASLDMIESLLSQTVLSFSGSLSSHHSAHDCFFHLVQQQHAIGLAAHGFRQIAAFLVTHIAGRRAWRAKECLFVTHIRKLAWILRPVSLPIAKRCTTHTRVA
jgi:hypothetical protein